MLADEVKRAQIVAEVGKTKITADELNKALSSYLADVPMSSTKRDNNSLRRLLLQQIIKRQLFRDRAIELGLLKADTPEEEEFLALQKLLKKEAFSEKPVELEMPPLSEFEEVKAKQILFQIEKGATKESKKLVKERAEMVLARIKEGEDFDLLAKQYSDDISRFKGGELGYFTKNQFDKAFSNAAFKLKPGEVSPIVETELGFHIILLEEIRASKPSLLLGVKQLQLNQEQQRLIEDYAESLRAQSRVIVYLQ